MTPECTAPCSVRDTLDAAIDVFALAYTCPFMPGQPLYDAEAPRVDVTDGECPARLNTADQVASGELTVDALFTWQAQWRAGCRECVSEYLEELAIAAKEARA